MTKQIKVTAENGPTSTLNNVADVMWGAWKEQIRQGIKTHFSAEVQSLLTTYALARLVTRLRREGGVMGRPKSVQELHESLDPRRQLADLRQRCAELRRLVHGHRGVR